MEFKVSTKGFNDIIDITDKVEEEFEKSGVKDGLAVVFVPHQTCAISVLEKESGLLSDLKEFLEKTAPLGGEYQHNKTGEGNAAAHLLASLFKPDLSVPVKDNKLLLGAWQQIVLIDFDNRARERSVVVKIFKE